MAKIVQYNIFGEAEPVDIAPRGYDAFTAKFKRKKTTDDCYTAPAVYDAVLRYVDEHVMPLDGLEVLRPFKPGGDYLAEKYGENTVVIDNPPFSIYTRIIRNYCEMGVRFFLFAPSLTMFVQDAPVQYLVARLNVVYENGAKVRTGFVTNMLGGTKVRLAGVLAAAVKEAQRGRGNKAKFNKPAGIYSSADLMRYCIDGVDIELEGSAEFVEKVDGRKIFGKGMQFPDSDTEILQRLNNTQNGNNE